MIFDDSLSFLPGGPLLLEEFQIERRIISSREFFIKLISRHFNKIIL